MFAVAGLTAFLSAMGRTSAWGDGGLWVFGGSMGALYLAAIAAMLRANRWWPPSLVWSAANMAFVLPILLSALFLGERLSWVDALIAAGMLLMLFGLAGGPESAGKAAGDALPSGGAAPATKAEGDRSPAGGAGPAGEPESAGKAVGGGLPPAQTRWVLLGIVFVTNGLLMLGFKLAGVLLPAQRPACLVTAMYGSGAVLAALLQVGRGGFRANRAEAGWGLATGAATGLSALALLPAMRLPAAAAFPVIQGTSLASGVLLCALLFRERLTPRKLAALAVGLGAMALSAHR